MKLSNFFPVLALIGVMGSVAIPAGAVAQAQKPESKAAAVTIQIVSLEKGASFRGTDFQAGCTTTQYSAKDDHGQTRMLFKRQVCNPVVLPPYVNSNNVRLIARSGLAISQPKLDAEKIWNKVKNARSSCPLTLQVSAHDGLILSSDFQCDKFSELQEQNQAEPLDTDPAAAS
jgi:hypothetical protein